MATVADMRDRLRSTGFGRRVAWAERDEQRRAMGQCSQCYSAGAKRRSEGVEPVRPYDICPHPNHWDEERCLRAMRDLVLSTKPTPAPSPSPEPTPAPAPTPTPAPTRVETGPKDPITAAIEAVVASIMGKVTGEAVENLAQQHEALAGKVNTALDGLDERIQRIAENAAGYRGVSLSLPDSSTVEMDGLFHEAYPELLKILHRRRQAYGYGPAGTGKTHLTQQLADGLTALTGTDIRCVVQSMSVGTSEADLTGWLLPVEENGRFVYVPSTFIDFYENGGLFGGDEFDNMDGNVAVILNAAFANDYIVVVKRQGREVVKRHKHFYFVAWANTVGLGADAVYTAREFLDGATRDRFAGSFVHVGYDHAVEDGLCLMSAGGDKAAANEATRFVRKVRGAIQSKGLNRIASMRMARNYAQDRACGDSTAECEERALRDWSEDERAMVLR